MATCPTCRSHYTDDVVHCTKDGETLLPDEAFQGVDAELQPGDSVGEYKVEGKVGEGGFGTVYRVIHPLIGKRAALKTLHRQYSTNPQMVSRFIAEARAVNQIRHRNIIDIFFFGALPDGRQYYLMELLDGQPFDQYIQEKGRLSPEHAVPILRSVARALDAAHAAGIAHRDLKPENIILVFDEDGGIMPKLLDFGIAKLLTTVSGGHKTRTGAPMGTPYYMSPEQCRGTQVDARTDIYAFGCLCHQVLTGRLPFDGEALMDILVKHMTVPPPRASEHCPDLKPELDAPILHMLAKEPGDRPASVGAALEELTDAARRAGYAVGAAAPARGSISQGRGATTGLQGLSVSQLGAAKTVAEPARTLTPAMSEVAPRPRGKLFAAVTVGVVVVGVAVGFLALHKPHATADRSVAAGGTATVAATVASQATPPSSAPGVAAVVPTVATPAEVEITVRAKPAHAAVVYLDAKKLGPTPGPFRLPYGTDPVTLTLKAPGYVTTTTDVTPSENTVVEVPFAKAQANTVNKDLANPF
jgi:hypothetical protein